MGKAQNQPAAQQQALENLTPQQAQSLLDKIVDSMGSSEKTRFVKNSLDTPEMIGRLEAVLPPQARGQGERLIKRAILTFSEKEDLQQCPPMDFIKAVLRAAEMGLAIDGKLCYCVKYKAKWAAVPDYKGLIAVAKRCGQIRDAYADVVCSKDQFRAYRKNGKSHLFHEPVLCGDRGEVICAYCVVILPGDLWRYEIMSREELDQIAQIAPSKNGPWGSPYFTVRKEMQKKSIVRKCLKLYCDDPAIIRGFQMAEEADDLEKEADDGPPVGVNVPMRSNRDVWQPQATPNGPPSPPAPPVQSEAEGTPPGSTDEPTPAPAPPAAPQASAPATLPMKHPTEEDAMARQDAIDDLERRILAAEKKEDVPPLLAEAFRKAKWLGGDACAQLSAAADEKMATLNVAPPANGGKKKGQLGDWAK